MKAALKKADLFAAFLFLYFVTLHADKLGVVLGGVNVRLNNVVALILAPMFFIRFRFQLMQIDRKLAFSLVIVTLSIVLSALFSPYKSRCFIFAGWFGLTLLCYILFPYLLMQVWDQRRIMSLYCASFVCVGIYALGQLLFSCLGINDPFAHQRITAEIVRPNAFAYEPSYYVLYMTPFMMMCNFHYITAPRTPFFFFSKLDTKKILFLNFLFLLSVATSAIIAYVLFALPFLFAPLLKSYRGKMVKFAAGIIALMAIVGLCFPLVIREYFMKFFYHSITSQASFYERWGGIVNAWHVFLKYPLLGVGLGGYSPLLMDAWFRSDATFVFFNQYFTSVDATTNLLKCFEPANACTEILACLGVVGLMAFGYLLMQFLKSLKRAFKEGNLLAINLALSVLIMLIMLQINQGLLRTYVWVHFSLIFAFLDRARTQNSEDSSAASSRAHGRQNSKVLTA